MASPTSTRLFKNVPVQDDSARKSLQTFTSGKGDVLLAYENEAIFAQQNGQDIDYVVPDSTILIENPVAVTSTSKHPEQAKAFLDFVRTPEAQTIFAKNGYRPVIDGVDSPYDFPTPTGSVHHRRSRRLDRRDEEVLRSRRAASWPTSSRHRGLRWLSADGDAAPRPASLGRRRSGLGALNTGTMFGVGIATLWLSLLVFIPLGAVVWRAQEDGFGSFWDAVTTPEAAAAIRLTVVGALLVACVNAVLGTLIAWVLVRDDFRGKRVVDALIDLPFALPTIVAGLVLLDALRSQQPGRARTGLHACRCRRGAAVRHAAVRRAHGAAGAASSSTSRWSRRPRRSAPSRFTTFRRIVLPNLLPAISAGTALAFARAISEFGATVLISGNLPFKTQVASVHIFSQIESDNTSAPRRSPTVLLVIALVVLLGLDLLQRWASRHA